MMLRLAKASKSVFRNDSLDVLISPYEVVPGHRSPLDAGVVFIRRGIQEDTPEVPVVQRGTQHLDTAVGHPCKCCVVKMRGSFLRVLVCDVELSHDFSSLHSGNVTDAPLRS